MLHKIWVNFILTAHDGLGKSSQKWIGMPGVLRLVIFVYIYNILHIYTLSTWVTSAKSSKMRICANKTLSTKNILGRSPLEYVSKVTWKWMRRMFVSPNNEDIFFRKSPFVGGRLKLKSTLKNQMCVFFTFQFTNFVVCRWYGCSWWGLKVQVDGDPSQQIQYLGLWWWSVGLEKFTSTLPKWWWSCSKRISSISHFLITWIM